MTLVDIRRFEMLTRVRDFGLEHASLFPHGSPGAKIFSDLNAAVLSVDREAITQYAGAGSIDRTARKASVRTALRETLQTFVVTAKAIAVAKGTAGACDKFRRPRNGDQRLLIAAKAFAEEAEPMLADFIGHGMAPAFIDDLNAQIADFETSMQTHAQWRETRAAARYGARTPMARGLMAAIRLDAIVKGTLTTDGAAMARWRVARHVEYPGRSHAHKASAPAQPPGPARALPARPAPLAAQPAGRPVPRP